METVRYKIWRVDCQSAGVYDFKFGDYLYFDKQINECFHWFKVNYPNEKCFNVESEKFLSADYIKSVTNVTPETITGKQYDALSDAMYYIANGDWDAAKDAFECSYPEDLEYDPSAHNLGIYGLGKHSAVATILEHHALNIKVNKVREKHEALKYPDFEDFLENNYCARD